MTSEQFLLALRRFVTCRGKPNGIISDITTHFKVTRNTKDVRSYGKTLSATFPYIQQKDKMVFYHKVVTVDKRIL